MAQSAGMAPQLTPLQISLNDDPARRSVRNVSPQVNLNRMQANTTQKGQVFSKTANMRSPAQATNLKRSVIYAVAGFCMGALSGVGITMLLWNGLKDRFVSGVDMHGNVDANGDINVDGTADLSGFEAGIGGWDIHLPDAIGGGADIGFDGSFTGNGLGFDGDAAVDIGGAAPVKVVVSVAFVFGIVVGAFTWLIERQLAAAADRKSMMEQQNQMQNNMLVQQNQILAQQAEMNQKISEITLVKTL